MMGHSVGGFQMLRKSLKRAIRSISPGTPDGLKQNAGSLLETGISGGGDSYASITVSSASAMQTVKVSSSNGTSCQNMVLAGPQMMTRAEIEAIAQQQSLAQQWQQQSLVQQWQPYNQPNPPSTATAATMTTATYSTGKLTEADKDMISTLSRCKPYLEYCDVWNSGDEIFARHLSTAKEYHSRLKDWTILAIEQTLREIQDQIAADSTDSDELSDEFIRENRQKNVGSVSC